MIDLSNPYTKGNFEAKYVINAAGVHFDTVHNMVASRHSKLFLTGANIICWIKV